MTHIQILNINRPVKLELHLDKLLIFILRHQHAFRHFPAKLEPVLHHHLNFIIIVFDQRDCLWFQNLVDLFTRHAGNLLYLFLYSGRASFHPRLNDQFKAGCVVSLAPLVETRGTQLVQF